jgi:TPR repeat protein
VQSISLGEEEYDVSRMRSLVEEGVWWIGHLATKHVAEACSIKAGWHESGEMAHYGVEKDISKALLLYQTASRYGDPEGMYKMGRHYEDRGEPQRAWQHYLKAGAARHPGANHACLHYG